MSIACGFPVPADESSRIRLVVDLAPPRRRDNALLGQVVAMVRDVLDVPVAFVSLMTGDTQHMLRIEGADWTRTPLSHAMCAFTVAERHTVVSPDTLADPRFWDHPSVIGGPYLRFFLSAPVILSNGCCLGTVGGVDVTAHARPSETQIALIEHLAAMVARYCEAVLDSGPEHRTR